MKKPGNKALITSGSQFHTADGARATVGINRFVYKPFIVASVKVELVPVEGEIAPPARTPTSSQALPVVPSVEISSLNPSGKIRFFSFVCLAS